MSYIATEWATGDTITAEKLNKLEGGVEAGNAFVVTITASESSGYIADATYDEIVAAAQAGRVCMARYAGSDGRTIILPLTSYKSGNGGSATFGHTLYGGAMDATGLYVPDVYVDISISNYVTVKTGKLRGVEVTG